jgi:hypothetical protein
MGDAATEDIDDAVAELLALPPESFTERRNVIAKKLRAAGRRDDADAVKALPRPPLSLWALNRLAREQPDLIDTFLAAADGLREAYRKGGDIRAATRPERDAEARVVSAAAEAVRALGKAATDTVLQSIGQTVHAAAANAEVAEALRSGRLIREPDAPSIDDLLGSLPDAAPSPPAGRAREKATSEDRAAERRELREQIVSAEAEAKRARSEERAATDAAAEARQAWEAAQAGAEEVRRRGEEADERLADLRDRLERL